MEDKQITSIYNLYYTGFLDQFQELLGWKQISKEPRSCYYQCTRLVTFVAEELTRFFMHSFINGRGQQDDSSSNAKYLCNAATRFMEYLDALRDSEDKWVATCANFLWMSYNFLEFVTVIT